MVANPERRVVVVDAALAVLGTDGARGLTHRAVDREAGLPIGSTANYFGARADLYLAMARRIFERLAPNPDDLARMEQLAIADAPEEYIADVARRLIADPDLARSLIELRLEAQRSADVAAVVVPFLRAGFDEDVRFHEVRGLPGGAPAVRALHHAINGLVMDVVTVAVDPDVDPIDEARRLARLLSPAQA